MKGLKEKTNNRVESVSVVKSAKDVSGPKGKEQEIK
jgi:hypothetical protein